jgi:homoserine dehydrogenase
MQIKDLEMSHDLARDELSAVRGGSNFGSVGGQQANQTVFGGHGIGSPVTATMCSFT